jgi:acetoin utilization deacetylase AcuC-like enzyme
MTIITDPRCTEYRTPGHPEKPFRVVRTVELLKSQRTLPLNWAEPSEVTREQLLRGHSAEHLALLETPADFDADTPHYPDIANHARRGVGGAIRALDLALAGEPAFSLLRPPGHHAVRDHPMGFCYLGSIALAALEARSRGLRVAVFDFDVHHGNGTEALLAGQDGIAFASIHQSPAYPGTGLADVGSNCFNHPVAPGASRDTWRAAFRKGLDRLLATKPQVLAVSAGFDGYKGDPLAHGTLEREDFEWLGNIVRETGIPAFSILEGGYSLDLPDLVLMYLIGWSGINRAA